MLNPERPTERLEEKAARLEAEAAAALPPPRQSSRDVSWSVMFRLDGTGVWVEWSNGHRSPDEAVDYAAALVPIPSVADIRFERITRTRDMFDLHGLAQLDGED